MKKSNFALRLQPSLMEEAKKVGESRRRGREPTHQRRRR